MKEGFLVEGERGERVEGLGGGLCKGWVDR